MKTEPVDRPKRMAGRLGEHLPKMVTASRAISRCGKPQRVAGRLIRDKPSALRAVVPRHALCRDAEALCMLYQV